MDYVYLLLMTLFVGVISVKNGTDFRSTLSRRKRYVAFPKGSTFVINLTLTKPLLANILNPITNFLSECDFPFPLPTKDEIMKAKFTKKKRLHYKQRRDLYNRLEDTFNVMEEDGNACVKRLLCDAKYMLPPTGKSVIGDMLTAILDFYDADQYNDHKHKNYCDPNAYQKCGTSYLGLLIDALTVANESNL